MTGVQARVWLGPERPRALEDAIERAGASLVEAEAANVIVWSSRNHDDPAVLGAIRDILHPGVAWVQLDSAGIEPWIEAGCIDRDRLWTAGQGAYAAMCAEHALALILAAAKRLPLLARRNQWSDVTGERVAGRTVGIVGAGGIGRETLTRLQPFGVRTIALTASGRAVPGADHSVGPDGLHDLLRESDYVLLAAPLTERTRGMIGLRELELLGPEAWLINVARGGLVDTAALVTALERGALAGALLDVTDPEPLPETHPLWSFPNVLITPHIANTWSALYDSLAERVADNIGRFEAGRPLLGVVDLERGY